MQVTLGALAQLTGGRLTDPAVADRPITGFRPLRTAGPEDLSFFRGEAKFLKAAQATQAGGIMCAEPPEGAAAPCLVVADVELAMIELAGAERARQCPPPTPGDVHPTASVDPEATLGEGVSVGPFAVVEAGARVGAGSAIRAHAFVGRGAVLGAGCVLHPGAVFMDSCRAGDRLVMWPFAVVGRDGFGFAQREQRHVRIPQIGGVVLGDDVEVGPMSTVDRGTLDPTLVEDMVKIDAHCHVAHNCRIGAGALLVGYARMAGSVDIGRGAILAQDVGVGEGRKVGDRAILGSAAGVQYSDVPAGATYLGLPARPAMQQKRIEAGVARLPELLKDVRRLRKRVDALEGGPE